MEFARHVEKNAPERSNQIGSLSETAELDILLTVHPNAVNLAAQQFRFAKFIPRCFSSTRQFVYFGLNLKTEDAPSL